MNDAWAFKDPKNVAVITIKQIILEGKPILRVFHDDDDGMWQFLGDHDFSVDDAMVISLFQAYQRDNTISEVADLPLGWVAWRPSAAGNWKKQKFSDLG